jgi:uncharacterized integral membrane protein
VRFIKIFFVAIISAIFIILCVSNREIVPLSLFPFPYEIKLPVFLLALMSMAVGVVATSIIFNFKFIKMNSMLKKSQKRLAVVEDENKILRSEQEYTRPAIASR